METRALTPTLEDGCGRRGNHSRLSPWEGSKAPKVDGDTKRNINPVNSGCITPRLNIGWRGWPRVGGGLSQHSLIFLAILRSF